MNPRKHSAVIEWLDRQRPESLWTTTVNLFELRYGIESAISETLRNELEQAWKTIGSDIFESRIFTFDMAAAREAANLAAIRRTQKRSVGFRDTFIAGIAISRGAAIATRNLRDFTDAGIPLVNPWTNAEE